MSETGATPAFPFTAVVGQDALKLALLLVVIDPKISGVLISGARGSAKSTLVHSLQSLLPEQPLVTLPLGASEEMVTGSIDLQQALAEQTVQFSPGLLARAHGGMLYVDEVNLLNDSLVDLLLDVSASGINLVERDGISHRHSARFNLVGTMNPDEGDLRPQLLDRFGLIAPVQTDFTLEQRKRIVAERMAYDDDPSAHHRAHASELRTLHGKVDKASETLPAVAMPEAVIDAIAARCQAARVEGLRADIVLYRACRAHAAFHGRETATLDDLAAVAELVLEHRRQGETEPVPPDSGGGTGDRADRPSNDGGSESTVEDGHGANSSGSSIRGSWGAMPPVPMAAAEPIAVPADRAQSHAGRPAIRRRASAGVELDRGATFRARRQRAACRVDSSRRPDWYRTLTDRANLDSLHRGVPRTVLRYRCPDAASRRVDLVLLDTSASTLAGRGLAKAKGVIRHLGRQAYLGRRALALITFGNDTVEMVLPPRRSPARIDAVLQTLSAGGGTPLSMAVRVAGSRIRQLTGQGHLVHLYLLDRWQGPQTGNDVADAACGNDARRYRHVAQAAGACAFVGRRPRCTLLARR